MTPDRRKHRNYWSSYKNPVWAWEVVFDFTTVAPQQLVWWAGEALVALYETGIYKVFALPEIGYASPRADPRPLTTLIADRFHREGVIDLLYFSVNSGHPATEIATSLAYFGEEDAIVTEDCKDLAALQLKTQPWLQEGVDGIYHRKPIVISGALFAPDRPNFPMENVGWNPKRLYLRITTYTDIWLPRVRGWNEPDYDIDRTLSNEQLAALNGTRLNEAIRRLRAITATAGGSWKVDEDFDGQLGEFDEAGVVFSASSPSSPPGLPERIRPTS